MVYYVTPKCIARPRIDSANVNVLQHVLVVHIIARCLDYWPRFSLGVENERADAGWDGRTCLVRPNCRARTGIEGNPFSLFLLKHEQDWQPNRVMPNPLYVTSMTSIHACILVL